MWCSLGQKASIRPVKSLKARSWSSGTLTLLRTVSAEAMRSAMVRVPLSCLCVEVRVPVWLFGLICGQAGEVLQCTVPEAVEGWPGGRQAGLVYSVEPPGADRLLQYQLGLAKDLQVLRDGWTGHWQLGGQDPDRERTSRKPVQDGTTCRVAQGIQYGRSGGSHAGKLRLTVSGCQP